MVGEANLRRWTSIGQMTAIIIELYKIVILSYRYVKLVFESLFSEDAVARGHSANYWNPEDIKEN